MRRNKKALVLLSGGLDSAVTLYYALDKGYNCSALIFNYGQRHSREIISAKKTAELAGAGYKVIDLDFSWSKSALLDSSAELPKGRLNRKEIPLSYVPGRNIVFLSLTLSYAEAGDFSEIFIGVNALDYSGYPDCRPSFIDAFNRVAELGTKSGVEGKPIKISAPLLKLKKSEIILLGSKLGVPFEYTWSCYQGAGSPCRECDSCLIRERGFKEANIEDPVVKLNIKYQKSNIKHKKLKANDRLGSWRSKNI
ncbi:MAG: 7-cyano-7-deazaguanine synthase QueC [Candidatus Omnitrophica bacterium]|nr:7-cyano-7-deazaguanine synthase QueC [Candidatus Omnitrophota bacterium]